MSISPQHLIFPQRLIIFFFVFFFCFIRCTYILSPCVFFIDMLHIKIDRRRPSSIFLTQPVLSKNEKQLSVSSDIGHLMLCNYSLYTVLKQEMPNKCKKESCIVFSLCCPFIRRKTKKNLSQTIRWIHYKPLSILPLYNTPHAKSNRITITRE